MSLAGAGYSVILFELIYFDAVISVSIVSPGCVERQIAREISRQRKGRDPRMRAAPRL